MKPIYLLFALLLFCLVFAACGAAGENAIHNAGHNCADHDCAYNNRRSHNDCTDNNNDNSHHNDTADYRKTGREQTGDDPENDDNKAGLRCVRFRHADNGACFLTRRHIRQRHLVADERPQFNRCGYDCGHDDHTQRDNDQTDNDRQAKRRSL